MCHKNSIVLHVLRTNYGENSVRNTDSDTQYCGEDWEKEAKLQASKSSAGLAWPFCGFPGMTNIQSVSHNYPHIHTHHQK